MTMNHEYFSGMFGHGNGFGGQAGLNGDLKSHGYESQKFLHAAGRYGAVLFAAGQQATAVNGKFSAGVLERLGCCAGW